MSLSTFLKGRQKTGSPSQNGAGAAPDAAGPEQTEMGFIDHLEELRWCLIKGFGGILLTTIACTFFSQWIIDAILLGPTHADFFMYRVLGVEAEEIQLLNRTVTGQFFAHIGAVVAVGVIVGSPIFIYQMWKFVAPGLYPHERKGMRLAAVFATFFFVLGVVFAYLIITPLALQFFETYVISEQIVNEFDITRYFSLVTTWAFGLGVVFELPVVIYFLVQSGIVTADQMKATRKYALIVAFILGAFLTPPDPISQSLVAIPLLLLYEASVHIAVFVTRRRERKRRRAARKAARTRHNE